MMRMLVVAAVLAGCRSGTTPAPPAATPPIASAAASASSSLPAVNVLLDDPRLASARAFERSKEYALAARAVRQSRPSDLSPAEACAWDFLEGRLFVLANETAEALGSFERASAPACPLTVHAKVKSAQALARLGRADEAIARAREIEFPLVADDLKMIVAESLAAKGDRAGALPLWRTWLDANAHGARWVDTSVRIANALLDGIDGPPEGHAKEAYDLATKVVVEAPKLADTSGAAQARLRAVGLLRGKDPTVSDALNDAERARQAQVWLDANEPQRALDLLNGIGKTSRSGCKAAVTRANAAAKKTPKTDLWADAVSACENDADLVTALYAGAKARTGKDPTRALEWFAKVEEKFPTHRLADDARFRAAMLIAPSEADRAEQMLKTLPDTYPAGDMKSEALFRVALGRMQKGRAEDWEAARAALDRIQEIATDDRHWTTAGRAEYFRGRVAEQLGDVEGARSRYAHVVERHPLTYYMILAHARLKAADAERAKHVVDASITKDRDATMTLPPAVGSAAFVRGVRLLEVGDIDTARRELATIATEDAPPETHWAIGAMYDRAGFPEIGHAFARGKSAVHAEHWPEGKWRLGWEAGYPRAFEPLVVRATEKYGLPKPIAWGIMREESSFIADVKSPANAYGLMQLIVPTARGVAVGTGFGSDEVALKKPEVSIELGTKLLAGLRTQHGHTALAIGAYNGGGGAVGRWVSSRTTDELDLFVENVPYEETRNYIKRVLSSVAAYAYLYDRPYYDELLALPIRLK
jgi:soluble lytic murein transglycosylase